MAEEPFNARRVETFPLTSMEFEPFRAALFRQRRQLLWLTFALTAYSWADITLGQEAESNGIKLHIDKPGFFVVAAIVAWCWALWRYWHYERTHADAAYAEGLAFEIRAAALELGSRKLLERARSGELAEQGFDRQFEIDVGKPKTAAIEQRMDGGYNVGMYNVAGIDQGNRKSINVIAREHLTPLEVEYAIREGTQAFRLSRPYSADYKAPYWIAMIAPLSLAVRLLS